MPTVWTWVIDFHVGGNIGEAQLAIHDDVGRDRDVRRIARPRRFAFSDRRPRSLAGERGR
jgi:hypothetical protein